jgi:hypothetical protein
MLLLLQIIVFQPRFLLITNCACRLLEGLKQQPQFLRLLLITDYACRLLEGLKQQPQFLKLSQSL